MDAHGWSGMHVRGYGERTEVGEGGAKVARDSVCWQRWRGVDYMCIKSEQL